MLKYQVSKRIEEAYASMNEGPSSAKEPVDYISDDVGAYDNVCDAVGRVVKSVSSHMVETDLDDAWTDARGPLEGTPFNVVVYATSSDIRRANLGTVPVRLSDGNWGLVTEIPFADSKPRLDAYAMMLSEALSDAGTGLSAEIDDRNSQIDDVVEDDEGNGYRGMMDVVLRFKVADEVKWTEFARSHEGGKEGVKKADVAESGEDIENEFVAMSDDELERAHLNAIRTRSVDLEAIRDEIHRRETEADKKAEF